MPPRKRQRQSQAGSPAPEPSAKSSSPAPEAAADDDTASLNNPWTDEEEIGLFKGLMKWKPTGIHKHFNVFALRVWLLENNYIHPKSEHTRPQGIWEKLNTLYDLPALDAREDARQLSPLRVSDEQDEAERDADEDADIYSVAANKIESDEFDPSAIFDQCFEDGDGVAELLWKARFPDQPADDSDAELPELNLAQDPPVRFTPSFSIEPSEAAAPSSRRGKAPSTRGRGGRGGGTASTRRSARKTESVADKEEEGEEGGSADDDEDSSEEDDGRDSETDKAPRRGRPSKGTRGKPAGRGRGRGRGRGK